MTTDETQIDVDGDDPALEPDGSETSERRPKHSRASMRSLRSARRLIKDTDDWSPADQVRWMLAEANVYAVLDLAEAIRGGREDTATT